MSTGKPITTIPVTTSNTIVSGIKEASPQAHGPCQGRCPGCQNRHKQHER